MTAGRRPVRCVSAVLLACALAASLNCAQAAAVPLAYCHSRWPVVAYRAGDAGRPAQSVHLARARLPVACGTPTGYPTSETTVAVTSSGGVFFSPAQSENSLARSSDHGVTWRLTTPPDMQFTSLWNTVDPQVVVDRVTGRLFWVHATHVEDLRWPLPDQSPASWLVPTIVADARGFQVYSTDDGGKRWRTADYSHENTADWEKLFVGPPPPRQAGVPQPTAYPNVVYVCANAPQEVIGPGRVCYRSLDGGETFTMAGYVFPSAAAPMGCPPLAANTGVVGRDGTIYIPQSCLSGTYLAVSRDEGATYAWLPVTGAPATNGLGATVQLAMDRGGNLYVLWTANDQLQLARSRDGGRTWAAPLVVSAPGLHSLTLPALAAGPAGSVGVAYYGSSDPSAQKLTGYISQTTDALAPRPLLYAGAINDPAAPIFENYGDSDSPRPDFIGAAYDAHGNLWAGMVKQFGAPDSSSQIPTTGYLGRLAFGRR